MSLYGKINVEDPKEKDFFPGAAEAIKAYKNAQSAAKEALRADRKEKTKTIAGLSGAKGYGGTESIVKQGAKWLRQNMGKVPDEEWYMVAEKLDGYADEQEIFHTNTVKTAAERALYAGKIGSDSDLNDTDLYDSRTPESYRDAVAELDNPEAFGTIQFRDGNIFTGAGLDINETLDEGWLERDFAEVPITSPDAWFESHTVDSDTEDDAAYNIEGRVIKSSQEIRNAERWYAEREDKDKDSFDGDDTQTAIREYSKAAAARWSAKPKEEAQTKKKQVADLQSLIDGIQSDMEVTLSDVDTKSGGAQEGSVKANYASLQKSSVTVTGSYGDFDEKSQFKVDAVFLADDLTPIIRLTDGNGTYDIETDYNESLFNEVESHMTSKYGKDSLTKLVRALQY